jgi:hypothetical protein
MKLVFAAILIMGSLSLTGCEMHSEHVVHGLRSPGDVSYDL